VTINNTEIKSICILRLSAIGDATHVLPVIASLQKAYPMAKITWIIGKLEHKLMQGLKGVDFIVFDKALGNKAYKDLKHTLQGRKFDVLMQMQYSFRANRAAWLVNAAMRIGFDKKRSREFHGYKLSHRIRSVAKQHVLDSFMEFVKVLGEHELIYQWNIALSAADKAFAQQFIKEGKANVIISPCSSVALKNWSVENYAHIIDFMHENYDVNVILCGGPSDYEMNIADQIERKINCKVINLTGKDTLKQLFALMQKVELVISPDSGPMHMASAAGTAVIGLHATSNAGRSGPYRYQHLVINQFEQACKKYLKKPASQLRWGGQVRIEGVMDLITPDMVKDKIKQVLK
jgi:heptosyltransferase I